MSENMNQDSTWKKGITPRGKCHSKTESKTTVSLYLNRNLVERARIHKLNLSRITEQALSSILDYLQTQNTESSTILNSKPLVSNGRWGRDWDLNPGARLHRPIGYQATSSRPRLAWSVFAFCSMSLILIYIFQARSKWIHRIE